MQDFALVHTHAHTHSITRTRSPSQHSTSMDSDTDGMAKQEQASGGRTELDSLTSDTTGTSALRESVT